MTQIVRGYKSRPAIKIKEHGDFPKYELICAHDLRKSFTTYYFGKAETPMLMSITGNLKETTFPLIHRRQPKQRRDCIRLYDEILKSLTTCCCAPYSKVWFYS